MGEYLACFKAYDVRGKVPSELNPDLAYKIGRAYADATGAKSVCIGRDIRLSGPALSEALADGLTASGVDVVDLGLVGTEMVYFATPHLGLDGGVMITASHNPPEYNGMKMVRAESRPISADTGLHEIEKLAHAGQFTRSGEGSRTSADVYDDFIQHLLKIVRPDELGPLKILADPGNGAAGVAMRALAPHVPWTIEEMNYEPDGNFPVGVPNPILPESRAGIERRMAAGGFDLGVAWDGDYDRCFFLDGRGRFIEGYYIVGLLAQALLKREPGATIIYDPRLIWNTLDIVQRAGGRAVMCKSGHAFIKEMMRKENAVYGGEMSAHHYFRDHWFCDSGMIPLLLVGRLIAETSKSLAQMVDSMISSYPCSGEVNSTVQDVAGTLARVENEYADGDIDRTDGLSVSFPEWRFNLRGSNTEPVIRLNVEGRGDEELVRRKTQEILEIVRA